MVKSIFSAWLSERHRSYKQSLLLLHKKTLTTGLNLLLIAATLTLLVLGWVFIESVHNWSVRWQKSEARIALYLSLTSSAQAEENLLIKLRATPGVSSAVSVSAEQGLIVLQKQQGMRELLHDLPSNPLPVVIHITPEPKINTPEKLKKLFSQIKSDPLVAHATLDLEWLEQVQNWVMFFIQTIRVGMILVSCMVLLNIGHSLRLLVAERTSDIDLMLRMGATKRWIIRPFLYLGVGYGLISAVLAGLVVQLICFLANQALYNTGVLLSWQPEYLVFSPTELIIFVIATTCLAGFFAVLFVRYHLRSIDCLGRT